MIASKENKNRLNQNKKYVYNKKEISENELEKDKKVSSTIKIKL